MNDDDEGNLSAEMENAIFNNINDNVSSTASKNNNNINIDNHVITNIELNNNKTKKVLTDNVKKKTNIKFFFFVLQKECQQVRCVESLFPE